MTNEVDSTSQAPDWDLAQGNGSVAHNIIDDFLRALAKKEDYGEVAVNLSSAIFAAKPTEQSLRKAMFGEDAK